MKQEDKKDVVLCIYDENGVSINDKILDLFEKYVLSSLQNLNA